MRRCLLPVLVLMLTAASSCNKEPAAEYFASIEYFVDDDSVRERVMREIRNAETRVDFATTRLTDATIAEALIAARDNGARVRVVADRDFRSDSGFQQLETAGIVPTYGDGELLYLPEPNVAGIVDAPCGLIDGVVYCPPPPGSQPLQNYAGEEPAGAMFRPGSFNLMSHNFAVIDKRTVWNMMRPFDDSNGPMFAYRAESERMREVVDREFTQLYGGVFSTDLDVYNGPNKSGAQQNPDFNAKSYLTDRGELELRFNPQDRLTKTIIDDTYRAKSSVWIVSDTISEAFLIDALNYKAQAQRPGASAPAFDVRVIVNRSAQSDFTRAALEATGVVRYAPADLDNVPTVALYDMLPDSRDTLVPRRVHVATQPIWRAGPFDVVREGTSPRCPSGTNSDCVVVHPADYFIDGNMWSLLEYRGQIHQVAEIDRFEDWFTALWQASEAP